MSELSGGSHGTETGNVPLPPSRRCIDGLIEFPLMEHFSAKTRTNGRFSRNNSLRLPLPVLRASLDDSLSGWDVIILERNVFANMIPRLAVFLEAINASNVNTHR